MYYGGSGARISMSCTRTRWASSFCFLFLLFFLVLQAPSVSHVVLVLSLLSPPFSINTNNRSTRGPSIFFFRRGPNLRLLRAAFFFPSPFLTYNQSYIPHSYCYFTCCRRWGPCDDGAAAGRTMVQACVISGRKKCNGMRDCRGSNRYSTTGRRTTTVDLFRCSLFRHRDWPRN